MKEILNKFLLTGDKFMSKMHSQDWIHIKCLSTFSKKIKIIQKFEEREYSK